MLVETAEREEGLRVQDGKINYSQFTCQVCGAKSEMYETHAPEIKDGLPPGWVLLYDQAVCAAHFDLVALPIKRALNEVVELLRPASELVSCRLMAGPLVHAVLLTALEREENKLLDAERERKG